jgi:hypothetical protein
MPRLFAGECPKIFPMITAPQTDAKAGADEAG